MDVTLHRNVLSCTLSEVSAAGGGSCQIVTCSGVTKAHQFPNDGILNDHIVKSHSGREL